MVHERDMQTSVVNIDFLFGRAQSQQIAIVSMIVFLDFTSTTSTPGTVRMFSLEQKFITRNLL